MGCRQASIECLCDLGGYQRDNEAGGDEVDDNVAAIEGEELLKDRLPWTMVVLTRAWDMQG